jgi:hypothetical protein
MSDLGRKGLGDQVKEKGMHCHPYTPSYTFANLPPATPDSQKSTLDKAGESVSGLGDKAASAVQPGQYLSLAIYLAIS